MCCSASYEPTSVRPSFVSEPGVPGPRRYMPSSMWMRPHAWCQSSSLSHWNRSCIASAMRQPWTKPNRVRMARAVLRPKWLISSLRRFPFAVASMMSAR